MLWRCHHSYATFHIAIVILLFLLTRARESFYAERELVFPSPGLGDAVGPGCPSDWSRHGVGRYEQQVATPTRQVE